ncbi:MAG: hypothetical protein ABI172_00880 [Ginsengibacter sp.]
MKKLFMVLAVSAFFVACNSGASSTNATKDSTSTTIVDTTAAAAPSTMDTTHTDSTHTMIKDSTHK